MEGGFTILHINIFQNFIYIDISLIYAGGIKYSEIETPEIGDEIVSFLVLQPN